MLMSTAFWLHMDYYGDERDNPRSPNFDPAWMRPSLAPAPGAPRCPVCGCAVHEPPGLNRFACVSKTCEWMEAERPVPKFVVQPPPPPPAPRQRAAVAGSRVGQDDWKAGLGPKVRETKPVKYKIGVGDAHNPVLELTAASDEEASAQAKKIMKKKLAAGEVREPRMGWVFHILSRG